MLEVKILYHDPNMPKLEFVAGKSDWIDLRASKEYALKKGDFAMIDLGVSMKLPRGFEAHVVPRSSTFKNFKIIQTNSYGVIDESYCGDGDVWKMPVLAVEDTVIHQYDRICQFRIQKKMFDVEIKEVDGLNSENRGGFGSTGVE